jgi:hypothetical protein
VEMLFVLSTLVGSKRKCEIQDALSNYEIIDIMNNYIEYLEWGNINESDRPFFQLEENNIEDESAYHGRGCKCDSDPSLKIQFLRFIYTFCSRDINNVKNKLSLFSCSDLQKIMCPEYITLFYLFFFQKYNQYKDDSVSKLNPKFHDMVKILEDKFYIFFYLNSNNYTKNDFSTSTQQIILEAIKLENIEQHISYINSNYDSNGIFNKLILKYIEECYYSSSKFWLASCIEVLIRGNNSFFQYATIRTGLMVFLLYDVIYNESDKTQILQLSFDILGELIKFNKANFFLLNYYFVDSNELNIFYKKIVDPKSLVDSNVFFRSILLSIEEFDKVDIHSKLPEEKYFTFNCKFCLFIKKKLKEVFNSLIKIVKPDEINQTNISCINTALVILIIHYNKRKLADFLQVKNL